MTEMQELSMTAVAKILRRRYGAMAKVARELGVSHVSVHKVLKGIEKSARVEEAARRAAMEILAQVRG